LEIPEQVAPTGCIEELVAVDRPSDGIPPATGDFGHVDGLLLSDFSYFRGRAGNLQRVFFLKEEAAQDARTLSCGD
jgi:hypothetical protein